MHIATPPNRGNACSGRSLVCSAGTKLPGSQAALRDQTISVLSAGVTEEKQSDARTHFLCRFRRKTTTNTKPAASHRQIGKHQSINTTVQMAKATHKTLPSGIPSAGLRTGPWRLWLRVLQTEGEKFKATFHPFPYLVVPASSGRDFSNDPVCQSPLD